MQAFTLRICVSETLETEYNLSDHQTDEGCLGPAKMIGSVAVRSDVLVLLFRNVAEGKLEFASCFGPEFTQHVKAYIGCELITHIPRGGSDGMFVSWVVNIGKRRRSYRSKPSIALDLALKWRSAASILGSGYPDSVQLNSSVCGEF